MNGKFISRECKKPSIVSDQFSPPLADLRCVSRVDLSQRPPPAFICSQQCPYVLRHSKVLDVIKAIWPCFNHWKHWAAPPPTLYFGGRQNPITHKRLLIDVIVLEVRVWRGCDRLLLSATCVTLSWQFLSSFICCLIYDWGFHIFLAPAVAPVDRSSLSGADGQQICDQLFDLIQLFQLSHSCSCVVMRKGRRPRRREEPPFIQISCRSFTDVSFELKEITATTILMTQ